MKPALAALAFILAIPAALGDNSASPLETVLRRMQALNAHDFAAFRDTYSDEVVFGVYPDRTLGRGHDQVEFVFADAFAARSISVTVHSLTESDSFVIADTTTTFDNGTERGLAIYETRDGAIVSVRFLRDTLRAERKPLAGAKAQ